MRSVTLAAGFAVLVAVCCAQSASADGTIQVLHSFCKAPQCGDGQSYTPVSLDEAGDLFGVAQGGATNHGLIYEIVPQAGKPHWTYGIIHVFCQQNGCPDGGSVVGNRLVVDVNGNVYGTTADGGAANGGTVFELSPDGGGGWTYSVVYNFCSANNCRDGMAPVGNLTYAGAQAGLLYDGRARLYGATSAGGGHFSGVAFALRPRTGAPWHENVVYAFCARDIHGCRDGSAPNTGLTMDVAGNLFGVTSAGGGTGHGVAFKLAAPAMRRAGAWTETVLNSFCSLTGCADGFDARSELVADAAGNLYGTTLSGGTGADCSDPFSGCGVLYGIAADGTFSVLHEFCSEDECADGAEPENTGGMTIDASGNVYGTAADGGLFEFSGGTFQVIHNFCQRANCRDGEFPAAGPTWDSSGHIFGTTAIGGKFDGGTAYEFSP